MSFQRFRAGCLLGTPGDPIEDGLITLVGDAIHSVAPFRPGIECADLGPGVVCPGFVNAHAHLDLSAMRDQIPAPSSFPAWLTAVVEHRRGSQTGVPFEAMREAAIEMIAGGTTLVGDIAATDDSLEILRAVGLPATIFKEVVGLKTERYEPLWKSAWNGVQANRIPRITRGISPHAPYSTAREVYRKARALSPSIPLATHWSESAEERQFLAEGTGPLHEFLQHIGAWVENDARLDQPLGDLLLRDGTCRWILVHANYLDDGEIEQVAEAHRSGRIAGVVYCPRTHAFFRHPRHPFLKLSRAGVPVALGTDSLASNPDLVVWNEARFLAERREDVAPRQLFEMLTIGGARVLGQEESRGSLEPGKRADLVVIDTPARAPADPYAAILAPDAKIAGVMIGGKWKHRPPYLPD